MASRALRAEAEPFAPAPPPSVFVAPHPEPHGHLLSPPACGVPPSASFPWVAPSPGFLGPPPPPPSFGFLAPPQPMSFPGPPPPPGCWGFPLDPGAGMQLCPAAWAPPPLMPMPPAPATELPFAPRPSLPQVAAAQQGPGNSDAPRLARAGRAAGARPRPRPCIVKEIAGDRGDGTAAKEGSSNEPSPRSVLPGRRSPISPSSVLPVAFPYPEPSPFSPPVLAGLALAMAPPSAAPATGSAAGAPRQERRRRRRFGKVRCREQKPRQQPFDPDTGRTSLMIRNIPNDFSRERVMNIIDQHCAEENLKITPESGGVRSEFDFLYVPIDFRTTANKGYAFVNLTTPVAAARLRDHLDGYRWNVRGSGKTCRIDHAKLEGREAFVEHFAGSCFDCDNMEYLPVWFEPARDGDRDQPTVLHAVGRMTRRRS